MVRICHISLENFKVRPQQEISTFLLKHFIIQQMQKYIIRIYN